MFCKGSRIMGRLGASRNLLDCRLTSKLQTWPRCRRQAWERRQRTNRGREQSSGKLALLHKGFQCPFWLKDSSDFCL